MYRWMSPEAINSTGAPLTPAADVYGYEAFLLNLDEKLVVCDDSQLLHDLTEHADFASCGLILLVLQDILLPTIR